MAGKGGLLVSSNRAALHRDLERLSTKPKGEYDKFRSFLKFDELDSEMKTGTLHGLNRYITKNYKTWKDKIVIGVAGKTGAGKSSLINALRGLRARDAGAAKVGNTETTTTVMQYPYPGNDRIILKDFPGVGSLNFPKEGYLEKTNLLNSNVVIVVSSEIFTENDIWIAQQVIENKRNVLFVRTKTDSDVKNSEHDYPGKFDEYSCLSKIRDEMETNIRQLQMNLQNAHDVIYLVSTRDKTYELDKLKGALRSLLNMENDAICQLLYEHMQQTIKSKTSHTETEFLGRKIWSAITGFLPVPKLESALDEYHVGEMIEECKKKYCIDEESLEKLAEELNTSKYALKGMLKSCSEGTIKGERLHSDTEDKKWGFFQKYAKYLLPGFGSLFSAYKSPCTIQECLEKICRGMANEELVLVRLVLEKLRKDLNV